MKEEWRIGDKVKHSFRTNEPQVKFWNEDETQEICEKNGCINLSLIGRKAAASTAKKVRRGKDGRFEKALKFKPIPGSRYETNTIRGTENVTGEVKLSPYIDWEKIEHLITIYLNNMGLPAQQYHSEKIVSILKENI